MQKLKITQDTETGLKPVLKKTAKATKIGLVVSSTLAAGQEIVREVGNELIDML